MKHFASILTALASLSLVTAIGFDETLINGKPLDITNRYLSGALDKKIRENYTNHDVTPNTVNEAGEKGNHRALRRHADCVKDPANCKSSWQG